MKELEYTSFPPGTRPTNRITNCPPLPRTEVAPRTRIFHAKPRKIWTTQEELCPLPTKYNHKLPPRERKTFFFPSFPRGSP
jgi:hypothetical protein